MLELLRQTDAQITCLARGEDDAHARERLLQLLAKYSIAHPELEQRVTVIHGDLAKPRFGVDDDTWAGLAANLDAIYHSGALVNFVYPYAALKATNVEGTREVLKLACTTRAKTLHHVSAVDVFVSRESEGEVMREQDPLDPSGVPHGYVQSKWVAEKLVTAARERGLPVAVYRPWVIMGHSETGTCHETDYMAVSLKGSLQLGEVPDLDMYVDVMPIDYVSRALVHISQQPEALGRIFHFANQRTAHLRQVYNWLRDMGYDLRVVPWEEWRATAINVDQSNALFSIAPLNREEPYHQELNPRIDCTNTAEVLAGSGIECPPVSADLLQTIVRYLVESGFMDGPQGGSLMHRETVGRTA
jgi:thioester reductase-like protein